ncbi:MAG TPA: hypothetical protein VFZ29_04570 [Solirubrobacterales bacterium]
MKQLKIIAASAIAAAALVATIGAGSASATTLEVEGATQNKAVTIRWELAPWTSTVLARTDGSLANTCAYSRMFGSTSTPYTGSKVTGALTSFFFEGCSETVTVDKAGQLYVEHIAGTTNGTVFSENAEVTFKTPFGNEVNCKTGGGTDIGTLTGSAWGWATLHINAVLNCGFLLPSATWKGIYETAFAEGLGVSA